MLVVNTRFMPNTYEFVCKSKLCAPPPVGVGGSLPANLSKGDEVGRRNRARLAAGLRGVRLHRVAKKDEAEMTETIVGIVGGAGGRMEKLESKFKTVHSLRRKIYDKATARGQTLHESATKISDALRYTGVIPEPPPGNYAKATKKVIAAFEAKGFKVLEVETHWPRGDDYNGIHLIVTAKNGTKTEIQMHTEESLAASKLTHPMFEKLRLPSTPPEEKYRLAAEMQRIADTAPIPEGALDIGVQKKKIPGVYG